ncbi:MAG: tetratricopeptide repeat protein [Bacteroidales bacterium]|nr:tetratricopeptide repeat protein [Bacteroidales bacterium]
MKKILTLLFMTTTIVTAMSQSREVLLVEKIDKDSTDWQSMVELAHYYKERSNSMRALKWTEMAYTVHGSDTLKRELATCYYQRADYEKCIELCNELMTPHEGAESPDSSEVYLVARCYEKMEMPELAMEYMLKEADRNIENQSNLVSLTKVLIDSRMAKVAVQYLEKYCEADSMNVAVNTVKAQAYYNAGYPRKAIAEYNKLMHVYGDRRPSTLYYLAMSYLQVKDKDAALMYLEMCNEKYKGTNGLALAMLGMVELDYDTLAVKGEKDIYDAIEMMQPDPNLMFRLYFSLGDYHAQKDAKSAIPYFEKADKFKPGDANLCYQLGYCYYMVGDTDNEYNYWSRYLQLINEEEDSFVTQGVRKRVTKIKEERFMKGN